MKCEFCERDFEKGPYIRVLRGKRYVFCSEGCFNLYHYKFPKFDVNRMYRETTFTIPAEVAEEILEEARK